MPFEIGDEVIDEEGRILEVTGRKGNHIELDDGFFEVWGNREIRQSYIYADEPIRVWVDNKPDARALIEHAKNAGFPAVNPEGIVENLLEDEYISGFAFGNNESAGDFLLPVFDPEDYEDMQLVNWPSDADQIKAWFNHHAE